MLIDFKTIITINSNALISVLLNLKKEMYGEQMKSKVESEAKSAEHDEKEEATTAELIGDFLSTFLLTFFVIIAVGLIGFKAAGFNVLTVDSGSMEPVYGLNSLIFVKSVEPETIQQNDIVTYVFNEAGDLVTHRVVDIDTANRTFTTKGDANLINDGAPVLWDNVVGKVVFGIPKVGYVFRAVTAEENRITVIVVIGVLVGLTLVWEVFGTVRDRKKEKLRAAPTNEEQAQDSP